MVLLVGGHTADVEPLLACLVQEGVEVVTAPSGTEALEALRTHLPQVILCDDELPDMSAWELLEVVLADPRIAGIPLVLVSRRRHIGLSRRKGGFPGAGIVYKPCNPGSVVGFLHKLPNIGPGLIRIEEASAGLQRALQACSVAEGEDLKGKRYWAFDHGGLVEILHRSPRGTHGPRLPEPEQVNWKPLA